MNCLKVGKWFPPCIVRGAHGIFDKFYTMGKRGVPYRPDLGWMGWNPSPFWDWFPKGPWFVEGSLGEWFFSENFLSHSCDFQSCWGYLMCLIEHFQNPGWRVIKKRASTGLWQQILVCHQWPTRRLDGTAQAEAVPNCMDFLQCFGGILLHMPFFTRSMSKLPSSADRGSNGRVSWRSQQSRWCSEWRCRQSYGSMLVETGNCERWPEFLPTS